MALSAHSYPAYWIVHALKFLLSFNYFAACGLYGFTQLEQFPKWWKANFTFGIFVFISPYHHRVVEVLLPADHFINWWVNWIWIGGKSENDLRYRERKKTSSALCQNNFNLFYMNGCFRFIISPKKPELKSFLFVLGYEMAKTVLLIDMKLGVINWNQMENKTLQNIKQLNWLLFCFESSHKVIIDKTRKSLLWF